MAALPAYTLGLDLGAIPNIQAHSDMVNALAATIWRNLFIAAVAPSGSKENDQIQYARIARIGGH